MVASYTELLARRYQGKLDRDADEFIGFAVDGATRMQTLIRDLLSYSRVMTQGRSLQPVDTRRAFEAACENLHKAIEESGVSVSVGALPVIQADATQMTQLFQNLLGNAVKYRNERTPRIHVDARAADKSWLFSVEDNGIGIEPQYFERIFQMFQRLHTRENSSAPESVWPSVAGSWNGTAAGSGSNPRPGTDRHSTSRFREPDAERAKARAREAV